MRTLLSSAVRRLRVRLPRGSAVATVHPVPLPPSPRPQQASSSLPASSPRSSSSAGAAFAFARRHYCTVKSPLHPTAFTLHPLNPTPPLRTSPPTRAPLPMSTEDCQGYEEALRAFSELGYDVYVHHHADREDVEKVVEDINESGHPCVDSKSMFLKSKKGELVLVVALLSTKTDMKRIQRETGTKDLRFAAADVLMENLHVVQGCVTPFALVNNVDKKNIALVIDMNVVNSPVPFAMRPCRNDRTALLTFPQLQAFLDKLGYTYKFVDFDHEPTEEAAPSPTTTSSGPSKSKKQKNAPKPEKADEGSA